MAESLSPHGNLKELTDSEMEAAQQLMQLSADTEESSNKEEKNQSQDDISSSSRIKEDIFRKEAVVFRRKERRFRSLTSIYMSTEPLQVVVPAAKKMRY
ncbi:PREDICTED: uncharacterized protein LOC104599932 [Nelumbo nucifera]|uniref:Uncharacterized protein LOC104599932 n=2 Tax=Nelumbo nucifera TaxID=4432 RepID=A0A1U8A3Q6_NELNU|nr:PREDICTED: uncharacterized protein LOC104599932 [Nelumbo nucifera]DAD40085.1 TPA_asm: hypothetical protein HUJ06_014408 [Nelumbo nucifera]